MAVKKRAMRNFNVRLPDKLVYEIDKIAEAEHIDRSDVVRQFLHRQVKETKAKYVTNNDKPEAGHEEGKGGSTFFDDCK